MTTTDGGAAGRLATEFADAADSPGLRFYITNTSEVGFVTPPADNVMWNGVPPTFGRRTGHKCQLFRGDVACSTMEHKRGIGHERTPVWAMM